MDAVTEVTGRMEAVEDATGRMDAVTDATGRMEAVTDATGRMDAVTDAYAMSASEARAYNGYECGSAAALSVTGAVTSSGADQSQPGCQNIKIEDEVDAPMYCGKYDDKYSFSSPMRAKVAIFNHYEFDCENLKPRKGTEHDEKALLGMLPKLGFHFELGDIEVHKDFTRRQIEDETLNLSTIDFKKYDCLMIFVLTHGGANDELCAKDKPYKVQTLWENFMADKCPTLAGKPKIFILQACRGGDFGRNVTARNPRGSVSTDGIGSVRNNIEYKIPAHADFLHVYSTAEGQACWRVEEWGSWFIQSLCKNLPHYSPDLDILKIITRTALHVAVGPHFEAKVKVRDGECTDSDGNVVAYEVHRSTRQVPALYSTLTRDLYFRRT